MNIKKIVLGLLLSIFTVHAQGLLDLPNTQAPTQEALPVFDPLFNDPALSRFINPDPQEEEYVYSIEQPPPPGTLLVWLRIIGVPIINAFFSVRRAVKDSIAWILAKFKNDKNGAKAYAHN